MLSQLPESGERRQAFSAFSLWQEGAEKHPYRRQAQPSLMRVPLKEQPAATDALLVFAFFAQKRLHGKTYAALFIGFDNLDADLLTFL